MSQKRNKKPSRKRSAKQRRPSSPRRLVEKDATGRTHLRVERDGTGKLVGFKLRRPLFEGRWQNEVVQATISTTFGMLEAGPNLDSTASLGLAALGGASKLIDGMVALAGQPQPACRAGCAYCCYQAVGVSVPEVLAIYRELRNTLDPEEFEGVALKVRDADDKTRGLGSAERLAPEHPCPFLTDQRCSIYAVRPLACRGKNSLDVEACRISLHDPERRAQFLAGSFAVPCFVEPMRAFHAVAAGLQLALTELFQLVSEPLELTAAMRVLFDAPESVVERWLAGADPFREARGGDASHSPQIRELIGLDPSAS